METENRKQEELTQEEFGKLVRTVKDCDWRKDPFGDDRETYIGYFGRGMVVKVRRDVGIYVGEATDGFGNSLLCHQVPEKAVSGIKEAFRYAEGAHARHNGRMHTDQDYKEAREELTRERTRNSLAEARRMIDQ